MKGIVSFHPVDVAFFDDVVEPLIGGRRINPEPYLAQALRLRRVWWAARRIPRALATILDTSGPPRVDPKARLWERVKTNLERIDYRPDELVVKVHRGIERDLHLEGRPFFVAEAAAEKVAEVVASYRAADGEAAAQRIASEQLARIDEALAAAIEPEDGADLSADLHHRGELLHALKELHDLARAARDGGSWRVRAGEGSRPADQALVEELPWRALRAHSKVVPFWTGRDVDGLETVCRAAGVLAPDVLVPAGRLFSGACESFPALRDSLHLELRGPRDVGAFVAPGQVPDALEFLAAHGARIIGAAARAGEGPAATTLLRKIKECLVFARRFGYGYVEASGIAAPDLDEWADGAPS